MTIRRNLIAAVCASVVGIGGGLVAAVATPSAAAADGAMMFPGSRQFLCWQDAGGGLFPPQPSNPACASVIAQAGVGWYLHWYANSESWLEPSPNGGLCAGGEESPVDFSPFNQARDDWPRTHLTAGDTYEFRHAVLSQHPGHFEIYITSNAWNPNTPLQWSELEMLGFVQDPPLSPLYGGFQHYSWDLTMPADRDGYHMLYVRWVRSDAPTVYLNCIDVVFDGGNGEVTFPGVDGTRQRG